VNSPTSTGQPQAAGTMERFLLLAVLLAYAVLAVLYAVKTPPWQVPDEPAHYNYIRQVAESGCCPVLEAPDWDLDYLSRLTGSGFDPQYLADLPAVQYEDHQPPLFYLLAAPVFSLSGGSLTALRLASALLGAGVILGQATIRLRS
jgi:predicted membrane-bound mannosyltransferase